MPRVGLTADNKQQSPFDYPKLQLDKGERARIVCIEADPLFEYVHVLRAPVLVDGKPVYEMVNKFGKDVEELKTDFIGRHICIGDYEAIADKGVDVKGCPVCRASKETDAVQPPDRRFAMHVAQYTTQPGSFAVQEPFSVTLKAWAFSNKIFDTIVDFATEWGDLKTHDLLLGPCTNKQYQKFDITVASKAEWLLSDERKKLVAQVYQQNQAKDLTTLIARKISREFVEEDLEKVLRAHRQAFGKASSGDTVLTEASAAVALDGLLGDESDSHKAEAKLDVGRPDTPPQDLEDLLGPRQTTSQPGPTDPQPQAPSQPGPEEPAKQNESEPSASPVKGETFDLDELLSDV